MKNKVSSLLSMPIEGLKFEVVWAWTPVIPKTKKPIIRMAENTIMFSNTNILPGCLFIWDFLEKNTVNQNNREKISYGKRIKPATKIKSEANLHLLFRKR